MKKLLLLAFVLNVFVSKAEAIETLAQLNFVNAQWSKNPDALYFVNTIKVKDNNTYRDWIATHLMLVEQTLRNRNTAHLNSSQQQNRLSLLKELNGYWHQRNFPVNDYLPYKTPIFIDRNENYCAVGFLMKQSGNDRLAKQISATEKFAYVTDIKTPGLAEWATANGFTTDELAWIQPGYIVSSAAYDLSAGLNGAVNSIVVQAGDTTIYVGGEFTSSINGVLCNNIAVYKWNWMPLGSGLNGKVNTMLIHNNQLIVGGEFTTAGGAPANHIAVYDLNLSQWQSLGSLDSTVNALAIYNNEIYAGGSFTNFFSKWTGNAWQDIAQGFMYGGAGVRTLEVVNNELMIGGDFELLTGALRKYVCGYDGSQMTISGMGTVTPVNDLEFYNGRLYAACDVYNGADSCALALFDSTNNYWEKVLIPSLWNGIQGRSIRALLVVGNKLYCGGDFTCDDGMYYGKGLMVIEQNQVALPGNYTLRPILYLDSTANCMAINGNSFYFGGEFITNDFTTVLNHIGVFDETTAGIQNTDEMSTSIQVFPNPANEQITIKLNSKINAKAEIRISDLLGNVIYLSSFDKLPGSTARIETRNFASGIYLLQVKQNNEINTQKLVLSH